MQPPGPAARVKSTFRRFDRRLSGAFNYCISDTCFISTCQNAEERYSWRVILSFEELHTVSIFAEKRFLMDYGENFLNRIKSFGLLRYTLDRILILISEDKNIDIEKFKEDFSNKEHPVFLNYHSGFKSADYAIEISLFNRAKEGEKDAIETLEKYRGMREYESYVSRLFDVQVI
jgi:hypothetical protein